MATLSLETDPLVYSRYGSQRLRSLTQSKSRSGKISRSKWWKLTLPFLQRLTTFYRWTTVVQWGWSSNSGGVLRWFYLLLLTNACIQALNIVIRMLPMQTHPYNSRSFFTDTEIKNVGHGFQLRRGYFQSLRPAIGRLLLNIDLSTGMFYKDGSVIDIALEVVGNRDPNALSMERGLPNSVFRDLERYLKNVRVSVRPAAAGSPPHIVTISSLTREGASRIIFPQRDGTSTNVAAYFRQLSGRPLQYPNIICAKVSVWEFHPVSCSSRLSCPRLPKEQCYHSNVAPSCRGNLPACRYPQRSPERWWSFLRKGQKIDCRVLGMGSG